MRELITVPDRAITLTGPWWWFMLHLPEPYRKKIENRKLGFSHKSFRGPVWVHASAERNEKVVEEARAFARLQGVPERLIPGTEELLDLPVGAVVGRFTITGTLPAPMLCELPDRWRMAGQFGFTVEDATPVPLVPCKGALGFWRVPASVLEQLKAAS
jgi:hypothetical protein